MLKKILLACTLLFSATAFSQIPDQSIEISEEKGVERHYYYFGQVRMNMPSFINYRVTNTGSIPLAFQRATISGIDFSARHSCTGVLLPGARCQFSIQYSPFFEGYHFGQFRLSFDQGYEILVDVSGHGVRF